ncbi:hypothetical protein [Verrucomicrobium spinosum]|uniref:hypothetical protein n=1 Tax=Verrucomicrobium spinosum TaxID=2736 RepID=UPI00155DDD15|nr:hypothetical protein [Verrucomicrobium spinosum]
MSGLALVLWLLDAPTKAEDIDFQKLNIEKFRAKAARLGRDPASITPETLREEFDPVATWVEYINRLTSLPVGLSVTAYSLRHSGKSGRDASGCLSGLWARLPSC